MAKKKTTSGGSPEINSKEIITQYLEDVLSHGRLPVSVFAFSKKLGINESEFYKHFNSFDHLENAIWKNWFDELVETLDADESYQEYSVREKMLSFYFTWLQKLLENRSYAAMRFALSTSKDNPSFLRSLKRAFEAYIHELMVEGKDTHEVASRPFDNQYPKAMWFQFIAIHRFWLKDLSSDFEETDAFIEKSVNFVMDLLAKGPIDSFRDLAKFLYQHKDWVG